MRTSYILPALLTLTTTTYALPTDSPVQANGAGAVAANVDPNVVVKIVTDARNTVRTATQDAVAKMNAAIKAEVEAKIAAGAHVSARTVDDTTGSGTNVLDLEAVVATALQVDSNNGASEKREAEADPTVSNGGVNAGTSVAAAAQVQAVVDRLLGLYIGVGVGAVGRTGVSA